MPRNTLSRRAMLQLTTGAAIAAPLALVPTDTVSIDRTLATAVASGPVRQITGTLIVFDESPVPSTLHPSTGRTIALDIAEGGESVLTVGHFDGMPDVTIALPADVARELDRVLFHLERVSERRIRENRAAGWIDCPMCRAGRYPCRARLCDEYHLVHPSAVTRHLGPWFTARDVTAELHRIPPAWGAVVAPSPYWAGTDAERLSGSSEDGRVEMVEIQLHGLGWGAGFTPEGDHPDGPSITLWPTHGTHHHPVDPDHSVEWCASLPDDPVHGACDTIGEALDMAVASIAGRVGDGLALAA